MRIRREISLADPGHLLAIGLGTGLMPKAPGTWGSVLAVPIFIVLAPYGQAAYAAAVAALFLAGVYLAGRTARALGIHDHNAIVIDEVAGMLATWVGAEPGWLAIGLGFVLFRIFDIAKPWPIRRIDRDVQGGVGIMLDDLLAGAMAAIVLQILLYWSPLAVIAAGAG